MIFIWNILKIQHNDSRWRDIKTITESEMDNLYAVGEFETILIAELNNDFDKIDAQFVSTSI